MQHGPSDVTTIRNLLADAEASLVQGPHAERARRDAETLLLRIMRDDAPDVNLAWLIAQPQTNAIVGARKQMHTVIAELCTGCELCVAPCPVDCIEMRSPAPAVNDAALNRARFAAHSARLANRAAQRQRLLDAKKAAARSAQNP